MTRLALTEAVRARVALCQFAAALGTAPALQTQLRAELGAELLDAIAAAPTSRLARLPSRAVAVVVELELRRKRRDRA